MYSILQSKQLLLWMTNWMISLHLTAAHRRQHIHHTTSIFVPWRLSFVRIPKHGMGDVTYPLVIASKISQTIMKIQVMANQTIANSQAMSSQTIAKSQAIAISTILIPFKNYKRKIISQTFVIIFYKTPQKITTQLLLYVRNTQLFLPQSTNQ